MSTMEISQANKRRRIFPGSLPVSTKPLSERVEAFCHYIVMRPDKSQAEAYRLAGYAPLNGNSACSAASRLLKSVKVQARIKQLREESWERERMSLGEAMRLMEDSLRTPIGLIDEMHPLATEKTVRTVGGGDGPEIIDTTIKMFPKTKAIEMLSKWNGWEKPKETTVNIGNVLDSIISFVRQPASQRTIDV